MAGRSEPGITPACAGKSHWRLWRTGSDWDHPRMCGEKCPMCQWRRSLKGSPPHVRGKDGPRVYDIVHPGITPAYAGKSAGRSAGGRRFRDHPRVCGEKGNGCFAVISCRGSPPRVRGKGTAPPGTVLHLRITPACAGKSPASGPGCGKTGDHPRVCGEKRTAARLPGLRSGSPPRVRGKASGPPRSSGPGGITPACAGKS